MPFKQYITLAITALVGCFIFLLLPVYQFKWESEWYIENHATYYDIVYFVSDKMVKLFSYSACVFLSFWIDYKCPLQMVVQWIKYGFSLLAGITAVRAIFLFITYEKMEFLELCIDGFILLMGVYKLYKSYATIARRSNVIN